MTQKRNEASNTKISHKFLLFNLVVIIVLFLLLTPKVSARLFPFASEYRLHTFIENTQSHNAIDAEDYWEFREFYSPGSFIFSKTGLPQNEANHMLREFEVSVNHERVNTPFLIFNSGRIKSIDFLTDAHQMNNIVEQELVNNKELIIQTDNAIMYRKNPTTFILIFLKTPEEMRKANGFFDYREADKELTENKYWFNITQITY